MTIEDRSTEGRSIRRFFRFRLSTLFIAFTILSIALGVFGVRWYRNLQEKWALEEVKAAGGITVAGENGHTKRVWVGGAELDDARLLQLLPNLSQMRSLLELDIVEAPVTDESLQRLVVLQQLRDLYIHETKASEVGLKRISDAMPNTKLHREKPDPIARGLAVRNIYRSAIVTAALSPTIGWMVTGSGDGTLRWWRDGSNEPAETIAAHENWLFSAVFSSDGRLLATGGGDNLIKLWDANTHQLAFELTGHTNDVHTLAFDPTGSLLYSAGDDKVVRIWDLSKKAQVAVLEGHQRAIPNMALTRDGRTLATASRDGTIRLWDVTSDGGNLLRVLEGHKADVVGVSFNPAGTEVASVGYDRKVRIWNATSGIQQSEFSGHEDWVFCVAFSPDGLVLVSGAGDGVRVWNPTDGFIIATYADQENVSALRFDPSGRSLISTAADGTVFVRSTVSGELTRILRTRYGDRGLGELPR